MKLSSDYYDGATLRNKYGEIVSTGNKNYDDGYSSKIATAGGKVAIVGFAFLAGLVLIASNILYILIIGSIYFIGTGINRAMINRGKSLLVRLPVKFLTFILVMAGLVWTFWDKNLGIIPAMRTDAVVQNESNAFKYMFSRDDIVASLQPGETIKILGATRNSNYFKLETASGAVGYTQAKNIHNAADYISHKQSFWDRMAEFSLSPRIRPLSPGLYESSNGDLFLYMDKSKSKYFEVNVYDENATAGDRDPRGFTRGVGIHLKEGVAAFYCYFNINKNRNPIELNGGFYNYTIKLEVRDHKDAPEVAPFMRYVGDYVITSRSSFARDGVEWRLVKPKDNKRI